MIITNIIGGLGNQMFQYAAALALADHLSTNLKIDTRGFEGYSLHQGFELNKVFTCQAQVATDIEIQSALGIAKFNLIKKLLSRPEMNWLRGKHLAIEPHFYFWPDFYLLQDYVYLDGYWQSEKYFMNAAYKVREAFTFKHLLSTQNQILVRQINYTNSISIHVRRGDYVTNSKNAFLGVCSLNYYQAAIKYIVEKIENPVFYIFSDDIDWVKQNLSLDFIKHYISHNQGADSHFDMQLMSRCKHHIIANSTFSWWGAWLNPSPNKIVIAPKQWFANNQNDKDLVPDSWVRL